MSIENSKTDENIYKEVIRKILDVALKLRIYREWQKSAAAMSAEYTDREILVLELIARFGPLTGDAIVKILGLSPSSVNELTKTLSEKKLIKKIEGATIDKREKLLAFNEIEGKKTLEEIEHLGVARYEYVLSKVPVELLKSFSQVLEIVNGNITTRVMVEVFGKYR